MEYGIPKLGFLECEIRYGRTFENSDTAIARFLSGEFFVYLETLFTTWIWNAYVLVKVNWFPQR